MPSLAVDMSHWGGPLTDQEAQCLKRTGYSLAIANAQGGFTRQQLDTAKRNGLRRQAYSYLYWDNEQAQQNRVVMAQQAVEGLAELLWLDAEADPEGKSPAQVERLLQIAVSNCLMPCGIYTRESWWRRYMGNSHAFKHLPLWDADYDGLPDLGGFTPYGGWTKRWMKQYGGTQLVCGQSVDVNVFEEDDVTREEYDALVRTQTEQGAILWNHGLRLNAVEQRQRNGTAAPPEPLTPVERRAAAVAFTLQDLVQRNSLVVSSHAVQEPDAEAVILRAAALLQARGLAVKVRGGQLYAASRPDLLPA